MVSKSALCPTGFKSSLAWFVERVLRCRVRRPLALSLRLRLHVSRHPDIFGAFTRIGSKRFSAFTRLQTSGCIIRGILAVCRTNTQMHFFGQVVLFCIVFNIFKDSPTGELS